MAKSKSTIIILVSLLVISIGFIIYLYFFSPQATPINDAFRTQLDRLSPDYLKNKELACIDFNGDWEDSKTKIGCFNIGTDWNSQWCSSAEGTIVEDICNGISGTKWVCDQNNAGCYYPSVFN